MEAEWGADVAAEERAMKAEEWVEEEVTEIRVSSTPMMVSSILRACNMTHSLRIFY